MITSFASVITDWEKISSDLSEGELVTFGLSLRIRESEFDWKKILENEEKELYQNEEKTVSECYYDIVVVRLGAETPRKKARIAKERPPADKHKTLDLQIFTNDNCVIWCHKIIVIKRNEVMERTMGSELKEESDKLKADHSSVIMMELLHFVYRGKVSAKFPGLDLHDILDASNAYDVQGLKLICHRKLIEQLEVGNCAELLTLADRYGLALLKNMAVNLATENMSDVKEAEKGKGLREELWDEVIDANQNRLRVCKLPQYLMDLKTAQSQFLSLLDSVKPTEVSDFLTWIHDSFSTEEPTREPDSDTEAMTSLQDMIQELRTKVPLSAILPSERTMFPEYGLDSDCKPNTTIHIDSFLYDEDDLDLLVEQGLVSRQYCRACGSHATAPLTFISHSFGVPELRYIFTSLLPSETLKGKILLDVGSRLGSVLYSAFLFSPHLAKIVGIEINPDLCKIQAEIAKTFRMTDKISVICDDVINRQAEVQLADVVVLNNVFQFFLPPQEQVICWRFLRENVKKGAILVTNPSLLILTGHLDLGFKIEEWAENIPTESVAAKFAGVDKEKFEDLVKICLYQVK